MAPADPLPRFSLALDGPLYRLYRRTRLLRPPLALLPRRLLAVCTIAWLPPLALALAGARAVSGVHVPFLADLATHIRLLVALPLLVAAEPLVHWRLAIVVREFIARGIVVGPERAAFESIVGLTVRMRDSAWAEAALLAVSTALGYLTWRIHWSVDGTTWYAALNARGRPHLTAAGWWYAFVSLNLFRFLLLRWGYRLAIWYRFLWSTSRLRLRLNPLHPDRAGGLGFLAFSLAALAPPLLATTVTIAGAIGSQILHDGVKLSAYATEIALTPLALAAAVTLPLAFFSLALIRTGVEGRHEYGRFAMRYVDGFRRKWLPRRGEVFATSRVTGEDSPLGSPDIQSLADLANGYEVVRTGRAFPVGARHVLALVIVLALPFLPLALTAVPLDQLIRRLLGQLI